MRRKSPIVGGGGGGGGSAGCFEADEAATVLESSARIVCGNEIEWTMFRFMLLIIIVLILIRCCCCCRRSWRTVEEDDIRLLLHRNFQLHFGLLLLRLIDDAHNIISSIIWIGIVYY